MTFNLKTSFPQCITIIIFLGVEYERGNSICKMPYSNKYVWMYVFQQYKSICAVIWIDEDMKNLESTLLPTKRPNLFYLINIFFQSCYLYLQSKVMFVACGGQTLLKIKAKKGISYLTSIPGTVLLKSIQSCFLKIEQSLKQK